MFNCFDLPRCASSFELMRGVVVVNKMAKREKQVKRLLTLVKNNVNLLLLQDVSAKQKKQRKWKEIAKELNDMDGGEIRTPMEWRRSWKTLRKLTRNKISSLRANLSKTGKDDKEDMVITDLDNQILRICCVGLFDRSNGSVDDKLKMPKETIDELNELRKLMRETVKESQDLIKEVNKNLQKLKERESNRL